jgi:surfeit locus 1 family protein
VRSRSPFLILVLSLVVGAACVRLGIWQLNRLTQRRARNAEAARRLSMRPADIPESGLQGPEARYRRARATGVFDYHTEVVLTSRSRDGAPGVYIVTGMRLPGTDSVLMVARGWAYSPDAATLDRNRWRERDTATVEGYVLPFEPSTAARDSSGLNPSAVTRLDRDALSRRFGVPLLPYYLMMLSGGSPPGDSVPVRVREPVLDEGSHRSYAIQWFLFAVIFGAGGTVMAVKRYRSGEA